MFGLTLFCYQFYTCKTEVLFGDFDYNELNLATPKLPCLNFSSPPAPRLALTLRASTLKRPWPFDPQPAITLAKLKHQEEEAWSCNPPDMLAVPESRRTRESAALG